MGILNFKKYWHLYLTVVLVVALDQLTKIMAERWLVLNLPKPVVPFFNLTLIYNKGAAFGIFSGLSDGLRHFILNGLSLVALLLVVCVILKEFRKSDSYAMSALALIVGGAIGNIADRIRFDYVVDFLDFYVGSSHWPAFNVADSAICVGVLVLIIRSFFKQNHYREYRRFSFINFTFHLLKIFKK
ncbi:MAG: signal peptidase II [Deltaproteobacteria bacterium]|jgi:signal peptidase II|nr:signal peptidase II [Deltaproteobacteria bacterium]